MTAYQLLMIAPMMVLLAVAAASDLRTRRIPNWLTLSLAACGLMNSAMGVLPLAPGQSTLGLLLGLVLNLPLFALRIRGGGDVKLFAAVGAWLGPVPTVWVFLLSTIVAAVIALAQAARDRQVTALIRNTAVLAGGLAAVREGGLTAVTDAEASFHSVGRPLPYAVPVMASVLIVLFVMS